MKKFFTYLFVFFGVLFVLEVGALAYLWYADPFGVRPLVEIIVGEPVDGVQNTALDSTDKAVTDTVDKNPALSPVQESTLETIGIDPAKLPTTITPDMKACFTGVLGATRVAEIEKGSTPTATEVFQTRACYAQ